MNVNPTSLTGALSEPAGPTARPRSGADESAGQAGFGQDLAAIPERPAFQAVAGELKRLQQQVDEARAALVDARAATERDRAGASLGDVLLDVKRQLVELRTDSERLAGDLRDAVVQRERELARLAADLATMVQDRGVNAHEMAGQTARHIAALEQQIATLRQEKDAVWTTLTGILGSTSWKATLPFQAFARKHPRIGRTFKRIGKGAAGLLGLRRYSAPVAAERQAWQEDFETAQRVGGGAARRIPPVAPPPLPLVPADTAALDAAAWPSGRPLVSVVIPCFNYGRFISDAIESVLAQTLKDVEIIVVEGGSTSLESREQVANLDYPRTRVFMRAAPARVGFNRNFGIEQARGKYICCLDADDKLDPTYLEKAVFLAEEYGYDVVGAAVRFFGNRSDTWGAIEHPTLAHLLQANHVPTVALFRKEMWRRAGGIYDFSEPDGHVHEDWAFWQRLAALGARFVNIRDYLFHYRSHGPSLSGGNLISDERMAAVIAEYNADLLDPQATARSAQAAAEDRRPPVPLRNLLPRAPAVSRETRTVLIAMPFTIIGGAERLLGSIVRHLGASGWRVILVTTIDPGHEHGDTTDWFREGTHEIYHLPRFLDLPRWELFVRYLFEAKQVDVLWIAGSAFFYDLLPALKERLPGLAVVDILFNLIGHTRNNRKHAAEIDLNIVENEELRSWLLGRGEQRRRISVIKSGVDLALHYPRAAKTQEVVKALGIQPGTLVVGFSGRWSEEKDPVGFIEIARLVKAANVAFVMTGTGHMRAAIEAALAASGFPPGRFHRVGEVPEVEPYLGIYDLLCLPSKLDGRPVVVLEALASGIPVLASSVGGLPELVEDDGNGHLFTAGDYAAFAAAIDRLAGDAAALETMKKNARDFAERELDARRMMKEYEGALAAALEEVQWRARVAAT